MLQITQLLVALPIFAAGMNQFYKPTEQQQLQRLATGDESTFESLFVQYYPGLLRYAKMLLPFPSGEAEDIVSDVFYHLWTQRRNLHIEGSLASYLYISVRNRIYDHLRKRKRQAISFECMEEIEVIEHDSLQPDQILHYQQIHQRISYLIEQLPDRTRLVFQMSRQENLTYEEIATILSISINSVKTHMFRALQFLKSSFYISGS